jgi:hypothetical protein
MITGIIGVGAETLITSVDKAKKSFVVGLFFAKALV